MPIPIKMPLCCLAFLLLSSASPRGATYRVTPDEDWFSKLSGTGLKPGDELVLGPGCYTDGRMLQVSHRGLPDKAITIRGEMGAVIRRPDARQNTINLVGARHVILRDLEITGGAAGIRIYAGGGVAAEHITLQNLHIHHIGGVGVTCNHEGNVYLGMVFRHNHIHHTGGHGEAFYLGCNNRADGSTPGHIAGALIEGNYIHDLNGPDISQGDGIELKDGSWGNVVRHNVIHDTRYPGITAYGTDGREPNVIEDNLVWSTGDNGIQVAAEARIRHNIIVKAGGDGIRSQPHQSAVPGDLVIEHNTVLTSAQSDIRISAPHRGGITLRLNRIRAGALRLEAKEGVETERNGPESTGARKFDRSMTPAWISPANEVPSGLLLNR